MSSGNYIKIASEQCKGCKYCQAACPKNCIEIGKEINNQGYRYAVYDGKDRCTACGLCFYSCPEPGTITVYKEKTE